ncbi:MAG TPA: AAA family ATPase [Caulobacteraceae bacterium]|nr:AAA family ATPase [Caulobacteraceae bacterium]
MSERSAFEASQCAIVAALEDGSACGARRPLKRIDTHMSHVFLGEGRAYKLKRSLRHPFADMSSVEARRQACVAELAVNRPLAPELYEAVLPVNRDPGGVIRIDGDGETVDWVVVMRRFPDAALLSELADADRLTAEVVEETAEVVAAFHASLPPRPDLGHPADYRRIVAGLRETEADGAAALGARPASEELFNGLERELARLAPLIEARRKAGWVRRGHGDLHLRNICLFDGRVTPFDALEFDEALSTADVIYDVAFLLMDLRARGLDAMANLAMNRYWDAAGQPEAALALLPLFMALRATVRMAVAVEAGDLAQAARYRELGLDLLRRSPPPLLAIGGLSGTGKSTLAKAVAAHVPGACGTRVLRTDAIRKAVAHVEETDRLGEAAYDPAARATIYRVLAERARDALAAGAPVIADGTFRESASRMSIEDAAKGHVFVGLWLTAPAKVRAGRVTAREGDASDATAKVVLAQVEPKDIGPAWRTLAADRTFDDLADEARRILDAQLIGQPS